MPAILQAVNVAQSIEVTVEHLVVRGNRTQVTIESKDVKNLWWIKILLDSFDQYYSSFRVALYGVDYAGQPRPGVSFRPKETPLNHHDVMRVARDYLNSHPYGTIQVRVNP